MLGVIVVAIALMACGGSATSAGTQQVRDRFDHQHDLLRKKDWSALYEMYSPAFQAACPYDEWLPLTSAFTNGVDLGQLKYDDVHVSISGDVAALTYRRTYRGKQSSVVTEDSPDIYRRINGAWYDEFDEHTTCL
jgi:hypothetical protein